MGGRNQQANLRQRNDQGQWIGKIKSTTNIASASTHHIEPPENTPAYNEDDTNADIYCLGKNFIPMAITNRTADEYPYDFSYTPTQSVPIVSGATALDHPNGDTYILVFHESFYYGTKLGHSLINPNQIQHNGIDSWDNPYGKSKDLCIDIPDGPEIFLQMTGTKLQFQT